uniref:Signal recognition particle subunit SRP72 n=1 Tax=Wollemia nobilis TaxID=56998 RepID=A0A0C9QVQ8_9CONI
MAPKAKPKPKTGGPPASASAAPKQQSKAEAEASSVSAEELFSRLDKHIKGSEYKEVIKVADEILGVAPADHDAVLCKLVALIQSDRIDQALALIQSYSHLPIDLNFHKAYCLYRCNRLDEALEALKGLEKNSSVLQLEAQILYRQGAMGLCITSYEKLIQKFKIDSIELKTNIIAAFISGGRSQEVSPLMGTMKVTPSSSFELAYNAACALIDKGNFAEAEELLLLARRIGQEMLIEEEYTDEEIENELAPISVQLAYVKQMLGTSGDGMTTYNNILKQKLADASSIAVATNNLIALKGAKDVFDSLKKFDKLIEKSGGGQGLQLADGLEYKLSARQKEAIYCNRTLLLLYANKLEQAREIVSALLSMFPDGLMPTLLQASLLVRENKFSRAEEILGQFSEKHPKNSTMALLARAQVAAAAGHYQVAVESMGRIPDIQHRLGTVATMVSLKEKAGDIDGAEAIFDASIEWWSNNMGEDQHTLELIMQEAASFKLKHRKVKAASNLFEQLVKSSSPVVRAEALNGLVSATAHTDLAKAEVYEKQLPPLPGLSSVDAIALEKTPGAKPTTSVGKHLRAADAAKTSEVGDDKTKAKLKRKRKRKPRYPKGLDPANPGPPPDPERWLPKRERSSYRPKRKDRRAAQVRGSQGAMVRDKPVDSAANGPSSSKSSQASSNAGKTTNIKSSSEAAKPSTSSSQRSKKKSRR